MLHHKLFALLLLLLLFPGLAIAEEQAGSGKKESKKPPEPQIVKLAGGKILLPVPHDWKQVKPRTNIIAYEFRVPTATKKDEKQATNQAAEQGSGRKVDDKESGELGRMTIMNAGGGVKANIARWVGQFRSADGKPLKEAEQKIAEKNIGPLTIHTVDLAGTFLDKPRGPFGPSIERSNYRMLAAIVPTKKMGTWFIKYYGPRKSVDTQANSFKKMIEGVQLQTAEGDSISF